MEDPEAAATVDAANAAVGEQLCAAFPHAPYAIQSAFMLGAYQALEQRQIGLFESPTGVGGWVATLTGHAVARCCPTDAPPPPHTQAQARARR
jgi:hypothetical protein